LVQQSSYEITLSDEGSVMDDAKASKVTDFLRGAVADVAGKPIPEDEGAFRQADLLQDLGCDSLDMINLLFQVEEAFAVSVPEPDIDAHELTKVGNLVDYVVERQA